MNVAGPEKIERVLDQLKDWPASDRIRLARRILETSEADAPAKAPRVPSRPSLLGLIKTDAPPPNDEECQAILEAELIKKHQHYDLESSIRAAVRSGRFASVDDAMAEAVRLLLRELQEGRQAESPGNTSDPGPDSFLGSMRDAAEELDEIVADAYRKRREETWRDIAVE